MLNSQKVGEALKKDSLNLMEVNVEKQFNKYFESLTNDPRLHYLDISFLQMVSTQVYIHLSLEKGNAHKETLYWQFFEDEDCNNIHYLAFYYFKNKFKIFFSDEILIVEEETKLGILPSSEPGAPGVYHVDIEDSEADEQQRLAIYFKNIEQATMISTILNSYCSYPHFVSDVFSDRNAIYFSSDSLRENKSTLTLKVNPSYFEDYKEESAKIISNICEKEFPTNHTDISMGLNRFLPQPKKKIQYIEFYRNIKNNMPEENEAIFEDKTFFDKPDFLNKIYAFYTQFSPNNLNKEKELKLYHAINNDINILIETIIPEEEFEADLPLSSDKFLKKFDERSKEILQKHIGNSREEINHGFFWKSLNEVFKFFDLSFRFKNDSDLTDKLKGKFFSLQQDKITENNDEKKISHTQSKP